MILQGSPTREDREKAVKAQYGNHQCFLCGKPKSIATAGTDQIVQFAG